MFVSVYSIHLPCCTSSSWSRTMFSRASLPLHASWIRSNAWCRWSNAMCIYGSRARVQDDSRGHGTPQWPYDSVHLRELVCHGGVVGPESMSAVVHTQEMGNEHIPVAALHCRPGIPVEQKRGVIPVERKRTEERSDWTLSAENQQTGFSVLSQNKMTH